MRLDARARRNLGAAALAWFLLITLGLSAAFVVVLPLGRDILDNDLTFIYIGARIGVEHGWSHIYSLSLQQDYYKLVRPGAVFNSGARFVNPPPNAWLVLPLSVFGAAGAVYLWLAASVAALAASWWMVAPGRGLERWLWLLAAFAWYPVLYSLRFVQPDLVVLFVVAASWKLADAKRPYLAGVVLGLSVLKPQVSLALPLVLLAAGRWKIVGGWVASAGLLALVSAAMIGPTGLNDYRSLLSEAQQVANNRYFTLAYIFGPGGITYVAQAAISLTAMLGAYLNRRAGLGGVFALGLLATCFGATYWHLQDYSMLVLAAWLFWREGAPAWQRWWLVVVAIAGELAWPLRPLPILLGVGVWFAFASPPAAGPRERPAR